MVGVGGARMPLLCSFDQGNEVMVKRLSAMYRRTRLQVGPSADAHRTTVIERHSAVGALSNADDAR